MEQAIKIKWQDLFKEIPGLKTEVMTNKVEVDREVIPIIFVPGIMGSRLKHTKDGSRAWDPDGSVFMAWNYLGADPYSRKMNMIGKSFSSGFLDVDNDNESHNDAFVAHKGADARRWGGVYWKGYGEELINLQTAEWPEPVGHCFELPVHACGYNWTDDNRKSGEKLAKYIDEVIGTYQKAGRVCKQVILVTHSMGGLVGRAACMLSGAAPKVLGVSHGVQPVTGAPVAYWRIKAGFERTGGRVMAWVMGSNGKDVTALLGNMPGGLELLPNKNYVTNAGSKQWLAVKINGAITGLPHGDPYAEIYREKTAWWRLVTPEFLEPLPLPDPDIPQEVYKLEARTAEASWGDYLSCLQQAESFHDDIGMKKHENTYNFYGSEYVTADKIHYTYKKDDWRQALGHLNAYANSGGFRVYENNEVIDLDDADGKGDGTVPESSGKALTPGTPEVKRWKALPNVEHEPFYRDALAQAYTWVAITNMCRGKILKEVYGAPPDW